MNTFLFTFTSSEVKMSKNNTIFIWAFIFYIMLNIKFSKCDYVCKTNNNLCNSKCFNNIIKFDQNYYRSGHFVTTKNGELIIEYSENGTPGAHRLFYRLKPDGRGYYPGDNPIKEIYINNTINAKDEKNVDKSFSGRYEARNIIVNLENDTSGKEYLFSTSSWYSLTEVYDLETHKYWTWFTTNFFNMPERKYIFSLLFDVLKQPNSTNYFLVYIQYSGQNSDGNSNSDRYVIKKFSFNLTDGEIMQTMKKEVENTNNYNNRVISSIYI